MEMQRIQSQAPEKFKAEVDDTAKRLNLLFDALNNGEVPSAGISLLMRYSKGMQARDFTEAQGAHTELVKQVENGGLWLVSCCIQIRICFPLVLIPPQVGLKRLMSMSRATPV